jgi:hypothetical protein
VIAVPARLHALYFTRSGAGEEDAMDDLLASARPVFVAVALVAATLSSEAVAVRVPGGGSPRTDCYGEFEVDGIASATSPRSASCNDGDPVCDHDGAVSGSCVFRVSLCANQTNLQPTCTPPFPPTPLVAMRARGSGVEPAGVFPPLDSSACGAFVDVSVDLRRNGRRAGKKKLRIMTVAAARPRRDADTLLLNCLPPRECPGPYCCPNPAGGPSTLVYTVGNAETDLDTGFSGVSHNFPVIAGARLTLCLTECDGATNPLCKASGPTGSGTLNTPTLGPPLPLFAAGVPVCVVNRFRDSTVQGTVNAQTGEYESRVDGTETPIVLLSDIYNTSANQVCPRCSGGSLGAGGSCDSGPNENQPCTTTGQVRVVNANAGINQSYNLSNDCPPGGQQGARTGTVTIVLPLTTGTDSRTGRCPGQPKDDQCGSFGAACTVDCNGQPDPRGGINQWCCSDSSRTPCFPTASNAGEPGHAIVRTGTPAPPQPPWPDPTYPKTASGARLVATFCIGDTGSATINQVAGIPGPGAVVFDGTLQWIK